MVNQHDSFTYIRSSCLLLCVPCMPHILSLHKSSTPSSGSNYIKQRRFLVASNIGSSDFEVSAFRRFSRSDQDLTQGFAKFTVEEFEESLRVLDEFVEVQSTWFTPLSIGCENINAMAAVGRTVRAQIVQLCAARNHVCVAGFRTTGQAGLDRSQSTSVLNVVPAAMAWEDFGVTYSAGSRDMLSAHSRGFATKDASSEEEKRVESKVREELGEPEGGPAPGVKGKAKEAVSKVGEKVKDAGEAIKGSTGNETVDKVGDTVKGAGDTIEDKGAKQQRLGKEDVVTS